MSSNTKIVVLRSKEVIYTIIILVAAVLIITLVAALFASDKSAQNIPEPETGSDSAFNRIADDIDLSVSDQNSSYSEYISSPEQNVTDSELLLDQTANNTSDLYNPGVYSSVLSLGNADLELQITVDSDHINSITLSNLNEAVETMYPLVKPTLDDIAKQIIENQSIENIHYSDENRYTSLLLIQTINQTLEKSYSVK
ncbi:MAG: hypothetical protein U0L56_10825 [Lachnospiraceae bacterium]|nr:hypothetical protein [Lachnospiraceae bacterium]